MSALATALRTHTSWHALLVAAPADPKFHQTMRGWLADMYARIATRPEATQ